MEIFLFVGELSKILTLSDMLLKSVGGGGMRQKRRVRNIFLFKHSFIFFYLFIFWNVTVDMCGYKS